MKSFQMPVTCMIIATTMIGSDIGSISCTKMRQKPPPSMRAALNSSSGMRRVIVAEQQRHHRHAEDRVDHTMPGSELNRCTLASTRTSG